MDDSSVLLDTNVLLSASPARALHANALRVLNEWSPWRTSQDEDGHQATVQTLRVDGCDLLAQARRYLRTQFALLASHLPCHGEVASLGTR